MQVDTTHLILLVLGAHYCGRTALEPGGGCLSLLVSGLIGINRSCIGIVLFAAGVSYGFVIFSVGGEQGRISK